MPQSANETLTARCLKLTGPRPSAKDPQGSATDCKVARDSPETRANLLKSMLRAIFQDGKFSFNFTRGSSREGPGTE